MCGVSFAVMNRWVCGVMVFPRVSKSKRRKDFSSHSDTDSYDPKDKKKRKKEKRKMSALEEKKNKNEELDTN